MTRIMKGNQISRCVCSLVFLAVVGGFNASQCPAAAVRISPGFNTNILPANDDGSTGFVPFGFTLNFYGTNFSGAFINNNGNITFDHASGVFTPFGLTSVVAQIVAPFFADVDTRGTGSSLVKYGTDTVNNRPAFGVNWVNVGYFGMHTDKLNSFQLVLIDRSDTGAGNVDMEFNYDRIQWETGDASSGSGGLGGRPAHVGFSNGTLQPGTFYEFPGSGVSGYFLDISATGLIHDERNSTVPGRYLFQIRGGRVQFGGLTVAKVADQAVVAVGSNLTYTITLNNSGTNIFNQLTVTDYLSTNTTIIGASASLGVCTVSSNAVVCNLGAVSPGNVAAVTITVVPHVIGNLCNTATITDTNGAMLQADACVTVLPARTHGQCITRTARYWFTHTHSDDPDCATLLTAIAANGDVVDLGFLQLPLRQENGDGVLDSVDTLIEALGFYYRNINRTGEDNGTQSRAMPGSKLCRARKELAVEMIAATANFIYLGTFPSDCSYLTGSITTNFSMDIINQARAACAAQDVMAVTAYTALLRKFNSGGLTNNFFGGLKECSPDKAAPLRKVSRDLTSHSTCPGVNDSCASAEPIIAPSLPFSRSLNLRSYGDGMSSPTCASGGANAVWKLELPTAAAGRHFTVTTKGSNLATMISIWRGTCDSIENVTCAVGGGTTPQASLGFTTDGTVPYYIVIESPTGQIGALKMKVTSP